jgi:hypothetical protein
MVWKSENGREKNIPSTGLSSVDLYIASFMGRCTAFVQEMRRSNGLDGSVSCFPREWPCSDIRSFSWKLYNTLL